MLSGYTVLNLVSTAGNEQTNETNDQRPLPRATLRPPPGPQPTSNMLPSLPQIYYSHYSPPPGGLMPHGSPQPARW